MDAASAPETATAADSAAVAAAPRTTNHHDLTVDTSENSKPSSSDPHVQTDDEEPPQSAIRSSPPWPGQFPPTSNSGESVSDKSNVTVMRSSAENGADGPPNLKLQRSTTSPVSPHALTTTSIASSDIWTDDATPKAQTRQEVEHLRPKPGPSGLDDRFDDVHGGGNEEDLDDRGGMATAGIDSDLNALRAALSECWILCNTLATLSWRHRERLFSQPGQAYQGLAWRTCWKLCQNLYEHQENDSYSFPVKSTLDLCREFCQALFEIRIRGSEEADSVLRVSFELNNHLYNTHDRNLPGPFQERTLDFYVTLCHRLMKQRANLSGESDALLRAGWSLAEMLFNVRQSRREGKVVDEELLGSTVQACWDLCDLFREGWTQVCAASRKALQDDGHPTFIQAFRFARRRESAIADDLAIAQANPETPTTIFDDIATVAADQAPVPNILILGSAESRPNWSSTSSTLSGYSSTSSSAHTIRSQSQATQAQPDDPSLTYLKVLVVRAAMNSGFQRRGRNRSNRSSSSSSSSSSHDSDAGPSQQNHNQTPSQSQHQTQTQTTLASFVKSLSSDSFGTLPWQTKLLLNYRKLVAADPAFQVLPPATRATAADVARAVHVMVRHNKEYTWLLDLYRWVFGFRIEEAVRRENVVIEI